MAPSEPPAGGAEPDRFEPGALAGLPPEIALSRLPVGRHGLPRSVVTCSQRLRAIDAMLRLLPQYGYPGITIGYVTQEAGISRAAFYEHFEGKEECFLATYDVAAQWLCQRVERAAAASGEWSAGVRAGASETLRLLAANPELAHLIAIEVVQAGPVARQRQQASLACFADALRAGRPGRGELPVDLEELLLGGALTLIARYVDTGRATRLPDVTAELVQYLLIPYLEPGETKRIADQAA